MPTLIINNTSEFPQMLLVLELGGTKYLYAERGPINITMDGSEALFQSGLMSQDIEQSVELFGTQAQSKSVTVQVDLANTVDTAVLLSGGVSLYTAKASIYSYAGGAFESAQRIVSGIVKDPIYGDPVHPNLLGFVIDRDFQERALIPAQNNYADTNSFDSLGVGVTDESSIGAFYPIIIGKPGYAPDLTLADTLCIVPTVAANIFDAAVADNRIVVALGKVLSTEIRLLSQNSTNGTAPLVYVVDDNGVGVTYADLSTFSGSYVSLVQSLPVYAGWTGEGSPGITGAGFRGLGDVVVWALSESSLNKTGNLDWNRINGNADKLNNLGRIDTWIQGQVKPLDWIINDVLSYFPVFVNDAGSGLYVDTWEYEATNDQAEIFIDLSLPGYERCSPMSWSSNGTCNVLTVEGMVSARSGNYLRSALWSGDPADIADNQTRLLSGLLAVRSNALLRQSFELFDRFDAAVSVPTVQDQATLDLIGSYNVYKNALPRAEVGYIIPWRKTIPRLGMVVSVTDTDMGLSSALGILSGYRYTQGTLQVRVSLLS